MFGDDWASLLAEELLKEHELLELLEMNDITEEEVIAFLIRAGQLGFPERFFSIGD